MNISLIPGEAVFAFLTELMKVIQKAQDAFMNAPDEYRERFYQRLNRWEDFWDKVASPLYRAISDEKQ